MTTEELLGKILEEQQWQSKLLQKMVDTIANIKPCGGKEFNPEEAKRQIETIMSAFQGGPVGMALNRLVKSQEGGKKDGE